MFIENEDKLRDYYDNMLLNNRYDNSPEEVAPPSTEDMSVYDLMGDDYYPYITKDANGDFTLTIEDIDNNIIAETKQINYCAIDGFADFCRRYLASYERIGGV